MTFARAADESPSPMKQCERYFSPAAGIILTLAALLLTGCGRQSSSGSGTADLKIDLGKPAKIEFVWIEPLQLYVGKYEISNRIYRRFKPEHNSGRHKDLDLNQDDQPVVNVSWNDAQNFCQWLTKNHGLAGAKQYSFRLPTEKEWQTFAACGKEQEYPWGPDWPPPKNWNYFGRENPELAQKLDNDDTFRVACPVAKSGPNAWGLFGVGGNVWEWCQDTDAQAPSLRMFKGGSWSDCMPFFLTLSRRSSNAPDNRHVNRGFRIVAESKDSGVEKTTGKESN